LNFEFVSDFHRKVSCGEFSISDFLLSSTFASNPDQPKASNYAKQTQFPGSFQDTQNEHNLSNNSELYQ